MTHIRLEHGKRTDLQRGVGGDTPFLVSLVEDNGDYAVLWDGTSYQEAVRKADFLRRDFGISEPVRDTFRHAFKVVPNE